MQQVYLTGSRLDAQRFQAFLARHEIEAEIREMPVELCESSVEPDSIGFSVWVADEQVTTAGTLLNDFQFIVEQTSEHLPPEGLSADSERVGEKAPALCRIPWLTALLCLACLIPSAGIWRESKPESTKAAIRWGWRDSLDVADGSYWAVLTSVLLHPTVEHLVMNLIGIAILGWGIERACGRICWTALTFAAILVSTAAGLAASGQLGVGASGVLFAFYGFTLLASVRRQLIPGWLLVLISIWLLYGFVLDMATMLDNYLSGSTNDLWRAHVHLAGFGLGLLFSLAFIISWKPRLTRTALALIVAAACVPLNGSPWLPDWLIARADREYRTGNLPAAIASYSQAISRSNQPADALIGRGEVLLFDGRIDESLADFDAALKLDPNVPNARALRAAAFEFRSDLDGAWDEANAELQNGQNTAYAYATRGRIAQERYEFETATQDVEMAMKLEPSVASHWAARAGIRIDQGDYQGATADADHALWLDPQERFALFCRGLIYMNLSQGDRGRTEIDRAFQLAQRELSLRPRDIGLHCLLSNMQLELFNIDPVPQRLLEAHSHAERALQLAPAFWECWRIQGVVAFHRHEYALAEQRLSRALEFNPRDAWAACHLGLTRHELGRSDEGLRDFDKALALNPRFGYAYRSRGLILNARKDYQGAIGALNSALELNPRFAEAYHLRGQARAAVGDTKGGRADLRRATELNAKYADGN